MSDSVTERALLAAGRCVAHRGIAATSLDVVASEAGVSRATLYRHFPDGRRQLFDQLVSFEVDRFFSELYREVEGLNTIEEVLERGLRHAHHAVSKHFLLQTVLREDPTILEPSLTVAMHTIESAVAEVFRPFLVAGPLRDERADFLARMSLDYISTQGRWNFDDPSELHQLVRDELLAWLDVKARRYGAAQARPLRKVRDDSIRSRVVEATLHEIAEGRLTSFTVASIVRRSGVSRATVYRAFPGGRDAMIATSVEREGARLFAAVADAMASEDSLHSCLLSGLTTVWRHVARHDAIRGLNESEPELVRRNLRFEAATRAYYVASSFAQPLLGRWLDAETAGRLAEWICRIVVSYWLAPASYLDVADAHSVATFYGRHLAPGVERLAASSH
jgi:AcrR family transcriptional regulator